MSNKPNPVAETAALLMWRCAEKGHPLPIGAVADLASRLHRIAPAAQWISEVACGIDDPNAEAYCGGVGMFNAPAMYAQHRLENMTAHERYAYTRAKRLDKSMIALQNELLPLGIKLRWGGDPRGAAITLEYENGREYHI